MSLYKVKTEDDEKFTSERGTLMRSDATNLYDLMADLRTVILQEPKRLLMQDWLVLLELDENGHRRKLYTVQGIHEGPECNTVGCFAGWLTTLRIGAQRMMEGSTPIVHAAMQLFPVEIRDDADMLFYGRNGRNSTITYFPKYPFPSVYDYGTIGYAEAAAANLDRFMTEHAEALKARQLPPVVITDPTAPISWEEAHKGLEPFRPNDLAWMIMTTPPGEDDLDNPGTNDE